MEPGHFVIGIGGVSLASSRGTSNGPDVTDVVVMMKALEEVHGVQLSLLLSPAGELPDCRMCVVGVAMRNSLRRGGQPNSVSRKRFFPSGDAKTLEGLIYRLLHELDLDCSKMWEQITLDL